MVSNMTRPYKQDLNGHVYYIYIAYIYTIFHICLMCPTYIHTYIYIVYTLSSLSPCEPVGAGWASLSEGHSSIAPVGIILQLDPEGAHHGFAMAVRV
jgi:hypothetical protein